MPRRILIAVCSALALIVLVVLAQGRRGNPIVPVALRHAAPQTAPDQSFGPSVGFKSRERWTEHFRKHGREFGVADKEEYLRIAQELRDRPAGGEILEAVRSDGVIVRFDRSTGAFLAFNRNGKIRTLFKPNDGIAYFKRQGSRGE